MLLQDEVGGPEIEYRKHPHAFIPLPLNPNEMIVNVSDTLLRWTNDVLKAGIHRVTVPNEMTDEAKTTLKERKVLNGIVLQSRARSISRTILVICRIATASEVPGYDGSGNSEM